MHRIHLLLLLLLLLALLLGWLYSHSASVNISRLYQLQALLDEASGLDASMERDMVNLRSGRLSSYESLEEGEVRLDALLQETHSLLPQVKALKQAFNALAVAIANQKAPLQTFISENRQLLDAMVGIENSAYPDVSDPLRDMVSGLHRDLLLYMASPNPELADHIHLKTNRFIKVQGLKQVEGLKQKVDQVLRQSAIVDQSVDDFIHCGLQENAKALYAEVNQNYQQALQGGEHYRYGSILAAVLLLLYCIYLLMLLNKWGLQLRSRNRELREFFQAVEQTSDAVIMTDREGVINFYNRAACNQSGYSADESLGSTLYCCREKVREKQPFNAVWQAMQAGVEWRGELLDRRKNGDIYPIRGSISPICNGHDEVTHFVGVYQDISREQETEEQLRQAQKMEAVGTLVGGIAHEFNNLLAGMTGNLYMARVRSQKNPAALRNIDHVDSLIFRAGGMIQQLLTFARKGMVHFEPLLLNDLLTHTVELHKVSLPNKLSVRLCCCDDELMINGDQSQLQQMLVHLINNARDAVVNKAEPCISITLDRIEADDALLQKYTDLTGGQLARLSVSDNGCGMDHKTIQHLFEPFFSTKEVGQGTGLGLAMIHGVVKTHGGIIAVNSDPGQGSDFIIYLPLLEGEEMVPDKESVSPVGMGHGETILFVDDEELIRFAGCEFMQSRGYKVLLAADGREAVNMYQAERQNIDLVILDVLMPGLNGIEVAQRIRAIDPGVKVIFATGYDKQAAQSSGLDTEVEVVLSKPFSSELLYQAISRQLDSD